MGGGRREERWSATEGPHTPVLKRLPSFEGLVSMAGVAVVVVVPVVGWGGDTVAPTGPQAHSQRALMKPGLESRTPTKT